MPPSPRKPTICSGLWLNNNPSLLGATDTPTQAGVHGWHCKNGAGVLGDSKGGPGVVGQGTTGVFGRGAANGVHGQSGSQTDSGVWGENIGTGFGVAGSTNSRVASGVLGSNIIGEGVTGKSEGDQAAGVAGYSYNPYGYGVFGTNAEQEAHGLLGAHDGTTVRRPVGVFGANWNGRGYAGYFAGNVNITRTLIAPVKFFRIDHPLAPGSKYLSHACVESSDMKNLYDGMVMLDDKGEATVHLPDWFEALNRDFRYQLTSIGFPSPNLHISREITKNAFSIAGGTPNTKVSWQVTGIRHDPYAKAHPVQVETEKTRGERGCYVYPRGYRQPDSKGIEHSMKQDLERITKLASGPNLRKSFTFRKKDATSSRKRK